MTTPTPEPYDFDEVKSLKADIERLKAESISLWIAGRLIATVERLQSELDRITVIAGNYAAQLCDDPLACRHCGMRVDHVEHKPLAECPLVLCGENCKAPERHHKFEPNGAL